MAKTKGFYIPYELCTWFDFLSNEDVGKLLRACMEKKIKGTQFPKTEKYHLALAFKAFDALITRNAYIFPNDIEEKEEENDGL